MRSDEGEGESKAPSVVGSTSSCVALVKQWKETRGTEQCVRWRGASKRKEERTMAEALSPCDGLLSLLE